MKSWDASDQLRSDIYDINGYVIGLDCQNKLENIKILKESGGMFIHREIYEERMFNREERDLKSLYSQSYFSNKGILKSIYDFNTFKGNLHGCNVHWTPTVNGRQCGVPRILKIVLEKTLEITNDSISDYEGE